MNIAKLMAWLLLSLAAMRAAATPTVTFDPATNSDDSASGHATITLVNEKWNISITKDYFELVGPFTITVGASTSEPIRFIDINQRGYSTTTLVHVRGPTQFLPCGSIDKIDATGTAEIKLVELNMNGDLGGGLSAGQPVIEAFDQVSGLAITGDVYGDITTTHAAQNSIYVIEGDVHGHFVATNGYHRDIQILEDSGGNGGNLYRDVIAMNGRIETLIAEAAIGTPQDEVNIWCKGTLTFLQCQDLYANVDTLHYGSGSSLWELYVQSSDPARGNFAGYLRALYVSKDPDPSNGAFVVSGDLTAEIDIVQSFREDITIGGYLDAVEPFFIGGNLHADCLLRFKEPLGLKGQVIINGDNGDYVWNGDVEFGEAGSGTPLSPVPYYNNKSADIGGGAVGRVPYDCYYKDCDPVGQKVDEASDGLDGLDECEAGYHALLKLSPSQVTSTVTVRHYGRVVQEGSGKPFTVWRKPGGTAPCEGGGEPNWVEVTSSFTHALPSGDRRAIEITGPFADGYDYLIEPKTSGGVILACDDTASSGVAVKDYDFRVRVFYLQNLSLSNGLDAADIDAWINDPVDTTLDGIVDDADLVDVIEAVAEYGG